MLVLEESIGGSGVSGRMVCPGDSRTGFEAPEQACCGVGSAPWKGRWRRRAGIEQEGEVEDRIGEVEAGIVVGIPRFKTTERQLISKQLLLQKQ